MGCPLGLEISPRRDQDFHIGRGRSPVLSHRSQLFVPLPSYRCFVVTSITLLISGVVEELELVLQG